MGIMELGSMAQIGAGIGRSMSPVAGAGIIVAGIAGINPMEMAKTQCCTMYHCHSCDYAIVTLIQDT